MFADSTAIEIGGFWISISGLTIDLYPKIASEILLETSFLPRLELR